MKIAVLEPLGISKEEALKIGEVLINEGHEIVYYEDRNEDIEVLKERAKDAEVLVIANMPLKAEVINSNDKLKMISVAFTGVDHVDLNACREKNITVCNAAGYSTTSVAELTFGLIISLLRNIVPLDKITREGGTKQGFAQNDLEGKTLGVIGTGAIGRRVIEIGKAFGCNILAYNRTKKEEVEKLGVKYVSIEELMAKSDIVSIHIPLNNETHGLINKDKIALMKEDAILINTARGPIVDNEALAEALKTEKIKGAGIDVFDIEPPLDTNYALLGTTNSVVVPHIGFATKEAMVRRAHITFDNITKWLQGNPQNLIK
ncbi:D-3-phosphoglycerate dehydrogenase [Clostridium pascui]|uniref:2-hydroxyacid dehydrogenase n=1 Tax=Clostridium pascui TaxID=46609 RepID=UPI0019597232|nr:2-hydroxyacid dehydrogenase [Clostridium pascui]MBM7868817.1 D-3-phosphoglycerate dehydrogenase [Clostridium pascui]